MKPVYGEGCYLYDADNKDWLDFRSGIMTGSLGYNSLVVKRGISKAINSGIINSYTNYCQASYELTEMLQDLVPGFTWKLFSTGVEAVDRALQIISVYLNRSPRIAAIKGGFHGKMMHVASIRYAVPWGNILNIIMLDSGCTADSVPDFDVLIYEPVQSLTGRLENKEWIKSICRQKNAFIISDEMVTGFYRTGKLFVSNIADIIVSGKGLGQGIPISVLGLSKRLKDFLLPVDWSTTAAANNLCANVGLSVLRYLNLNQDLVTEQTKKIENFMKDIGCETYFGALGFYHSKKPEQIRKNLDSSRILATIRDDGVLRLGPAFIADTKEFERLQKALEK